MSLIISKDRVDQVKDQVKSLTNLTVASLHGDMDQADRIDLLGRYRKKRINVMVATDVAARGLDISGIRSVVCMDA